MLSYNGSSVTTSYDFYPFGAVLSVTGSEDRYKYIAKELDDGYGMGPYYFAGCITNYIYFAIIY